MISWQQRDVNRSPDPVLKITAVASSGACGRPGAFSPTQLAQNGDRFAPIAVMAGEGCTGTGRQNIMPGAFGSNQLKAATSGALPLMNADTSAAGSGLETMYPWT